MLDVTVTAVANLHLGLHELLTFLAIPLGTWWAWRSRYNLARIAMALRRRSLFPGRQEAAERLPMPPQPLRLAGTLKDPLSTSVRLVEAASAAGQEEKGVVVID